MKYYRNIVISVSVVMSSAIVLVAILAWVAIKPTIQKNGFNRIFLGQKLTILNSMSRSKDISDIVGITEGRCFFSTKDPSLILSTDRHLDQLKYISLSLPVNKKIASLFYSFVDSPNVTILAGNIPAVINTSLNSDTIERNYKFPGSVFTRAAMISPDLFVFRGTDSSLKTKDQIFLKGNLLTGTIIKEEGISERNNDAGISTDGMLHYDKKENKVVYINYYSNQFVCMDTSLNLIYKAHCIDTFSVNQASAEEVTSSRVLTNILPKRTINSASTTAGGYLFNNSNVLADNESINDFKENSVIDIYSISTGDYKGSFYIPAYKNEKMRRIKIVDDLIYVFYKSNIIQYQFSILGNYK